MKLPLTELARHWSKHGHVSFAGWDSPGSYRVLIDRDGGESPAFLTPLSLAPARMAA